MEAGSVSVSYLLVACSAGHRARLDRTTFDNDEAAAQWRRATGLIVGTRCDGSSDLLLHRRQCHRR